VNQLQTIYQNFLQAIYDLFRPISDFFTTLGLPFGPLAWFVIISVTPLILIIIGLALRGRHGTSSTKVDEGIRKIIASTGDVSAGMAGVKKLKFLKTPAQALVFLKIEENAIQQALTAVDYYTKQGDIDESLKTKISQVYDDRLSLVREAIAKDEEFKSIVDTSTAVDRARSDYLQKLAAMSGTSVESDEIDEAGPTSVGLPGEVTKPPSGGPPAGGPPGGAAPSGGPPGGGPPSGGPPRGGPPGGAAPSGGPSGGGPPGGGPPSGAVPSGGPPGGSVSAGGSLSGSSPGGAVSSGSVSLGAAPKSTEGKSSLQSEMLQEMERLKALMGGD
jgi:hypothetical protein